MTEKPESRVGDDLHVDLTDRVTYASYLDLATLFSAHRPLTTAHDEHLFITIHHVQELWLHLIDKELDLAIASIRADDTGPALKALARVGRVQEQLNSAWDVLSTLTPADYLVFRGAFGQASGFQSYRYRKVEFRLGAKDRRMLLPHRHEQAIHAELEAALNAPSIYDETLALLARRGFAVPPELLARDLSEPHVFHEGLRDLWVEIYRDSQRHFEMYELAEKLVDVEDRFQQWRFRHMKTVERIIGFKRGSGGSSGVGFLKSALDRSFFPELWAVRTQL
ncbi:tryptophan 2,3-dioxygenase [Bosea sp. PAMC 26642]|uniref:tryptophan 2,3-dioxygenase n=1 Tax=Bosea sp. (strain PAMC 26642) TaxID=1792307 RepID=UPI000770357A|nr:tryptophan 2,3-dioxygenase family protein [Bosea sp. PAMC 26642]AMJ61108.1 tryptophan 2,3-dioxygenase [Bosea sp. PAMC 26642]